ncbi:MAG: hypothetical protein M0Z59_06990 [Nitrospiraceae bacterium]|nr:hypothetical protein [Nitrospiraceae bacterium]
MSKVDEIKNQLSRCSEDEQHLVFEYLRSKFPIHPIEKQLNTTAEVILEAIARAGDLTQRGVRGIIAEAAFKQYVVSHLKGWRDITPPCEAPYDFLLDDSKGQVRIQVKMQRLKNKKPMMANEGYKFLSSDKYAVETQKTRGGKDKKTNSDTRPYRFGEFDILAVAMHPSTGDWNDFGYTVADWLIARSDNEDLLLKFQPVAKKPNEDWTGSLEECIKWFRDGIKKKIAR